MGVTFEQVPALLEKLIAQNDLIQKLLEQRTDKDELMSIDEAAKFLKLKRQTLYQRACARSIPHMKEGKKLLFSRNELTAWLKSSSRKVKELA